MNRQNPQGISTIEAMEIYGQDLTEFEKIEMG
jgi:hypothetical protein